MPTYHTIGLLTDVDDWEWAENISQGLGGDLRLFQDVSTGEYVIVEEE